MENSINKEKVKRFGEITILNIDNSTMGGYIKICNENDYIDSTVVTVDEIMSLYTLSFTQNYVFLETHNNKMIYQDGYIEIESPFAYLQFTKKDFVALCEYIFEVEKEKQTNGK